MRVLITADAIGGVWTYARELVTGLADQGLEIILVSFGEIPTPEQTAWMEGLPNLDYRPTGFRLEWMQEAEGDLEASGEYLHAVIREVKPDLLHLNQYCYGSLPTDLPKIVVAHSDVVSWWVSVHGEEPRDNQWMQTYRQIVRRGIAGATAVVAPSAWMLNAIQSHYLKPARGLVIHNGRSPALFNPHMSKEEFVLSVGRLWDAGKQVALLTQCELPLTAQIAGSEQHPESGQRRARGRESGRVLFRGRQNEAQLRQLYSRAAIYAATSRYEPFGLAPVEAALSRCALVVNDIPSLRELWADAVLYFRRNDPESLAQTITRLHRDPELRMTYADLAYRRASERFTSARMVADYLELYHSLVPAGVMAA